MKQFLQLQPRTWKKIYSLYLQNVDTLSPSEIQQLLQEEIIKLGFTPEQASPLVSKITSKFTPELRSSFDESETEEARLSLQDIKTIRQKLLHEPSLEIRTLLIAFAVYVRANPHPSFWIKYDKKVIGFLGSIQKLRACEQISLTNRLHTHYNLDMQVVGSNQPIPCFKIQWQAEQPPISEDTNPLVLLGPLSPSTIKEFAKQLPYEELPGGESTDA